MWEEKIVFLDGWFVYMDGKGNNSIISHNRARMLELGYQRYQASMDVNRGGAPDELAYPSRGFTRKGNEFVYEKFRVDQLIIGKVNPIPNILHIPKNFGAVKINSIAREAFKNELSIEKIVLHDDIHTIGDSAFEGCKNLNDINLSNKNIEIKKDAFKDTSLFSREVSYLNNVLVKVETTFKGVLKVQEGTLGIADEALCNCAEITKVDLPEGLVSIGNASFKNCQGIVELSIPESVQTIGENAFCYCTKLEKIKLPKTIKKIGMAAFSNCENLRSVTLPEGICEIERAMFYKCDNLFEIDIPKTVQKIWFNAFDDSGFINKYKNSIDNELYIGDWLIHYKSDNMQTLNIKNGTIGISDMNWSHTRKIESVKFPNTLKYIGDDAFTGALFDSLKLPENLTYIGKSAFRGTNLKEIAIPNTVENIGIWAFMDCENLESITIKNANTNINWPAITGRKDKKSIIVYAPPKSTTHKYCLEYGKKNNLIFKPLSIGFLSKFFK